LLKPIDDDRSTETAAELLAAAWQRVEDSRSERGAENSNSNRDSDDVIDVESTPA
jgi:hypothetical protein